MFGAGTLIQHFSSGMFLMPAILHGITVLIMLALVGRTSDEQPEKAAHLDPEPGLMQSRTLALWLSRIALPAMYVVNFSLGAILPNMPVIRALSPAMQTVYGSIWIGARMIMFVILTMTVFWHTRPRLLLISAIALLIGFVFMTLTPQPLVDPVVSLVGGQIVIGVAMGLIYTASLYFGMVLSQGSTEHGGYHEALIGLGGTIGPGAGALTQYLWPGNLGVSIMAVGGVVGISVVAAIGASILLRERRRHADRRGFEVLQNTGKQS
jgi:hypothetical protein